MSLPAGSLDDARLTVSHDYVWHLHRNRLDTFESWYDESLVGKPLRHTGDRANLRLTIEVLPERRLALFLKRHEPMGLRQKATAWLRLRRPKTPARVEWDNLHLIASLGVATSFPVALGEDPATGRSFVVTAEIEGGKPADDFARERFASGDAAVTRDRRRFVRRLGEMVRRLHAARLAHRDLYLCHVFVRESPGGFEVHLIDLQRLGPFVLSRWRVKDVAQLEFSRPEGVFTRTDAVRFLRAYFNAPRLDPAHKRFAKAVLRKAARIRRREMRDGARFPGGDGRAAHPAAGKSGPVPHFPEGKGRRP